MEVQSGNLVLPKTRVMIPFSKFPSENRVPLKTREEIHPVNQVQPRNNAVMPLTNKKEVPMSKVSVTKVCMNEAHFCGNISGSPPCGVLAALQVC